MNTGTITTAATVLAVAAAIFAGCAAEETLTPPSPNTTSPSGSPANTVAGVTGAGNNNTTANTAAAVTNSNTTVAATTTTGGAVTATTAPAVTATTAPAVTATTAAAAGPTTGGAATATSGGGSGCNAPAATGTEPMIDDFEDNDHTILSNEGRLGYWYQYGDDEGTQTTAPVDGVDGTGGVLTSTGAGFSVFGAGVGVDLNNDNAAGEPCEYDASVYTGIQFNLTTDAALSFKIALKATAGDSGHYEFPIAATDSGLIKVPFTMLAQPTWAEAADWDPSKILQLQWQAAADIDFTITLDDVSFY